MFTARVLYPPVIEVIALNHAQARVAPETVAGCLKIALLLFALVQIQISIPMAIFFNVSKKTFIPIWGLITGVTRIVFTKKSFLQRCISSWSIYM